VKIHNDKYFFGSVKVGERGQVIIPKEARDSYKIVSGDSLFFFGDKRGLAIVKASSLSGLLLKMFKNHFVNLKDKDTKNE
jgi:AbrB family looped-hinge helix DNA binding protein